MKPAPHNEKIKVLFDLHHLYYLPQFLPVAWEMLQQQNFELWFSPHTDMSVRESTIIFEKISWWPIKLLVGHFETKRRKRIINEEFHLTIFGKHSHIERYCSRDTLAVSLYHGIGMKSCYYTDYNPRIDVRYIESQYRLEEFRKRGIPTELVVTGFPKLDPLLRPEMKELLEEIPFEIPDDRPVLLYAPTFYPGSIEIFGEEIANFTRDVYLLVKLHNFSWRMKKYRHQAELFQYLSKKYHHIYLVPEEFYNILPLYQRADFLLTEASSTAFEFLITGKPVIVASFFYLRRKHRLFYSHFKKSRMDEGIFQFLDFAHHLTQPEKLPELLRHVEKRNAEKAERIQQRREQFLGITDGKASQRVVQDLLSRVKKQRR